MNEQKLSAFLLSLMTTVLLLFMLLGLIALLYHPEVDLSGVLNLYNGELDDFKPEPRERVLFVAGLLLLPFTLFGVFTVFSRFFKKKNPKSVGTFLAVAYPCQVIALVLFTWFVFKKNFYYYFIHTMGVSAPAIAGTVLAGAGYILFMAAYRNKPTLHSCARILDAVTGVLVTAALLMGTLVSVFGLESVKNTFAYTYHFNAVFHSVVQVYLGKQLLVDLINQYGLFPHFIDPLFKIFGLSVLKFTLVMSLLWGVSYLALYLFIRGTTTFRTVGNLGFTALVYSDFLRGMGSGEPDIYFQYYPVRVLFPALSIYLVYRYLKSESTVCYLALFGTASIALLWNFDSGAVVFLSWLLLLIYRECRGFRLLKMLQHLCVAGAVFVAVAGCYTGLQYVVYGHLPDFNSFLVFQKAFYISGFFMLPMPLWHPWNLVALVYAAGLLYALASLAENEADTRSGCFFFLSILGFGLLSYYQGRSHSDCLIGPSYPSVIMITLYADSLFGRLNRNSFPAERALLLLLISPLIFCSASLINEAPGIAANVSKRLGAAGKGTSTYLKRNVGYVKANTGKGEEVLFLTGHSGIYSLATGTPSPVRVAGPSEMLLVADCDKISAYLASGAGKVFMDQTFKEEYAVKTNGCNNIIKVLNKKFDVNYINPFVYPGEDDAVAIFMMLPKQ